MKALEEFGFTEEQKEYIKGIMEQKRLKTHKTFFDRYGVKDLGELDSLFEKAKLHGELKEKEKKGDLFQVREVSKISSDIKK